MRMMLWRSWLIAAHLVLAMLLYLFVQPAATQRMEDNETHFTPHYQQMLTFHLRGDALLPPGRILFLGDSLMQGLPVSTITEIGVNYGIGSDDTRGLLHRLTQYDSLQVARAIVISVGINDLKHTDDVASLARYRQILTRLPESVPAFCVALLPIDEPARKNWAGRTNRRISEYNRQLDKLCTETGAGFVSVAETMRDNSGNLLPELHDGDGLHLNAAGNMLWGTQLRRALSAASLPVTRDHDAGGLHNFPGHLLPDRS
jgi:lysophospholipase L1-like esterase